MANFQLGTRVKRIRCFSPLVPVGAIGTVVGPREFSKSGTPSYRVKWDGIPQAQEWGWFEYTLSPILPEHDADFERFMQKITKTEPIVEMVRLLDQQVRA